MLIYCIEIGQYELQSVQPTNWDMYGLQQNLSYSASPFLRASYWNQ
jgi:hypothetical protein